MSTSTLVLNYVAWFVLTVVVSAVAVGVPFFLDRATRTRTKSVSARTSALSYATASRAPAPAGDRDRLRPDRAASIPPSAETA